MDRRVHDILQISTADRAGGAEAIAMSLFTAYRETGMRSRLVVGRKLSGDPDVLALEHDRYRNRWTRYWISVQIPGISKIPGICSKVGQLVGRPVRRLNFERGREDFDFPGTFRLLDLLPRRPDIVHAHNLHGGYFDLRALPALSRRVPFVLTLHDAWLLAGHCAHSFDCRRWKTGCGRCPDLTIPPAIKRDATSFNWARKKRIYAESSLHVAAPSRWLMGKVQQSILAPAICEARVIPHGVDLDVFQPAEKSSARETLHLPVRSRIVLLAANGIRTNPWKDFATLREALVRLEGRFRERPLLVLALGERAPDERLPAGTIRFVPPQVDPRNVARYYQAADLYVHAARADTFPNTVLESLACGTPVLASAVGGIVEQVKSLSVKSLGFPKSQGFGRNHQDWETWPAYPPGQATGVLVPAGDAKRLAGALEWLLGAEQFATLSCLSENAARDARRRFDRRRMVDDYLSWYDEILLRNGRFNDATEDTPVRRPALAGA